MASSNDQFKNQNFINVQTYRKNGEAVSTPVWFVERDGRFYVRTIATAGKVKRIRNNPKARVMPCDQRGGPLGEWANATARLMSADEDRAVNGYFQAKYGFMKRVFDLLNAMRRSQWQAIELSLS